MGRGDQFMKEKFSVRLDLGSISQERYEIAVGIRCDKCKKRTEKCKCATKK